MRTQSFLKLKTALLLGGAMMIPQVAHAQETADDAVESVQDAEPSDEIIVTGFRASLNAAVSAKREAVGQVDVIVAEDIAKFPDTNLAESLQRIPGVAIERDAGEGRAITVRGLGGDFTRVRINGMETIATSVNGASYSNGRSFDFNVFASELFNSIVVNKTAAARLNEGSLGAVIDLNTGNPLSYGAGLKLVASAQARYNDLNDDVSPRIAGLVGWNNIDETFGVSASVAWSKYQTAEIGNNTVRWQATPFQSVDGVDCTANPTDAGCAEVASAFHPRIPRYGNIFHDRERLGATAAIQFRPSDRTEIEVNGLYSKFEEVRREYYTEVLLRSNEDEIDLSNYVIDENNNIISADLTNAWIRNENYRRESGTDFYQVSGKLTQSIGDRFTAILHGGFSESDATIPVETTFMFDDRDGVFSYDYTNMKFPLLVYGTDVADPTNFQLSELRDRPSYVNNKFKSAKLDIEYDATDGLQISFGPFFHEFEFDTSRRRRDTTYCAGFGGCAPGQYGYFVTPDLAQLIELGDAGQPDGTTTVWTVADLDAVDDLLDFYGREAALDLGATRTVSEKVTGGYFQTDFEIDSGVRMTGNFGIRYAHTEQDSSGYNSGVLVNVKRSYDDFLPAINLNVFPADDFIIRGAIAKVMTRPGLGALSPGGSVDEFNFRISSGNPFIDPFRAWNYDLSFEYYFAPGAIASLALFRKDIESFPVSVPAQITYAQSGLPTSLLTPGTPVYDAIVNGTDPNRLFETRRLINGEGASIQGVELGINLPFSAFSEGLSDFGVLGNVTYVDSSADYEFTEADLTVQTYTVTFPGVSKWSANGTVYYDNGKFSIRASAAYRSDYNTGPSGTGNFLEGFDSTLNIDMAIRYALTDRIELLLDGNNLTDEYRSRWTDLFARRNYENNHFGRTIMVGARVEL